MTHHAQLITPVSLFLANCCKVLGVSEFGTTTPPYKLLVHNVLHAAFHCFEDAALLRCALMPLCRAV